MAEAIVSLAVERITDLLIHEAVFLTGVNNEVENLKTELKRMQCFLKDVDRKQEQDERLRNRVAEIRDLAYDAEHVIDSYILQVAHQGGFHGIVKRFTSIFNNPFRLRKIGKQRRLRRSYSHVEDEDVVSLEGSTKDILDQLMKAEADEDRLHVVVSIVGMGRIGKTTVAKKVYNHNDVKSYFDCCAWAFISQHCNTREVLIAVLIKALSPSEDERRRISKAENHELVEKVYDVLKEKRYLVVLDDIWRSEDWDSLKPAFPRGKNGSKILFTTRNKDVALHADPCSTPIELPFLTDDASWELFVKKAFPGNKTENHGRAEEFVQLGKDMVKKCGGLPLAIVLLGGLLAAKKSRIEWEMVHKNINEHLMNKFQQGEHHYRGVKWVLALSYIELPFYLKPCFLYMSHYPEDWEISKKELIRLWIAEGFISSSSEGGMLMEDVGEEYLMELINRCLIQIGKRDHTGTKVRTCRIHDLLRNFCVSKAQEENFLGIIQQKNEGDHVFLRLTMEAASKAHRIAIHPSQRHVCLEEQWPNLRSLLMFQNKKLIWIYNSEYNNFRFLRVLNVLKDDEVLRWWHVSSEIGNLLHLRYLGLQCDKIILPKSIGNLISLHTLHIQAHFIKIPNVLFKLKRLRHFLLVGVYGEEHYNVKGHFPQNMVTLKYIKAENLMTRNGVLNLPIIRNLGVMFKDSEQVKAILGSLFSRSNHLHLQTLRMKMASDDEITYADLELSFVTCPNYSCKGRS
ncbi:Disease resistance protein [Corchorus olitorius]|uniref:Disease resistance protein n=1 Tax=Corchorus olitorius TaxID=93759 RepID=A0A1R3I1W6_9ROSI|nr:Disease resistance protein [Corchorus olitorius]